MSTIVHSGVKGAHAITKEKTDNTQIWDKLESMRFGVIPLYFILIPCLAGIAASTALFNNNLALFAIAGAPAMVVETLIIGMASMRSVTYASIVSVLISIIVMFI